MWIICLFISFSDPIVLAEDLSYGKVKTRISFITQHKKKFGHSGTAEELAKKGNDGLGLKGPHICSFCLKRFCGQLVLQMHLESIHLRTKKTFCDLCPKFYFTLPAIRKHMTRTYAQKKFSCNVCDYKTAWKQEMMRHKLIHDTKVECPICKKQVTSLPNHMPVHKPKFPCAVCHFMYHKADIRTHMNTHRIRKCKN